MIAKKLLCPELVRRIPQHFSWVDHRLVREHYIENCTVESLALYLLLVTVGDAEGISYYSDSTVTKLISISETALRAARKELAAAGLIAYRSPLYQVLSLERRMPLQSAVAPERGSRCVSIGDVLRMAAGGDK